MKLEITAYKIGHNIRFWIFKIAKVKANDKIIEVTVIIFALLVLSILLAVVLYRPELLFLISSCSNL